MLVYVPECYSVTLQVYCSHTILTETLTILVTPLEILFCKKCIVQSDLKYDNILDPTRDRYNKLLTINTHLFFSILI